jgi:hypothetical protein
MKIFELGDGTRTNLGGYLMEFDERSNGERQVSLDMIYRELLLQRPIWLRIVLWLKKIFT